MLILLSWVLQNRPNPRRRVKGCARFCSAVRALAHERGMGSRPTYKKAVQNEGGRPDALPSIARWQVPVWRHPIHWLSPETGHILRKWAAKCSCSPCDRCVQQIAGARGPAVSHNLLTFLMKAKAALEVHVDASLLERMRKHKRSARLCSAQRSSPKILDCG